MGWLRGLWTRHLAWRSTPGKRPPRPERATSKVAAAKGAIASAVTSNYGSSDGTV